MRDSASFSLLASLCIHPTNSLPILSNQRLMLLVVLMGSVVLTAALDLLLLRADMRALLGNRFGLMNKALDRRKCEVALAWQ